MASCTRSTWSSKGSFRKPETCHYFKHHHATINLKHFNNNTESNKVCLLCHSTAWDGVSPGTLLAKRMMHWAWNSKCDIIFFQVLSREEKVFLSKWFDVALSCNKVWCEGQKALAKVTSFRTIVGNCLQLMDLPKTTNVIRQWCPKCASRCTHCT